MARKLRVKYAAANLPCVNCGGRREPIFDDDPDRRWFLETLAET